MKLFILKYKNYLLLVAILLVAASLIFFRLDRADIQTDDATYSFRALGYLDYMDSVDTQTTPLIWFDQLPWWSKLSFHDAPPLAFIIQFIFFKLFGVSVFTARLPFALAGIISVLLIYLIVKKLHSEKVGLLSALILSILTSHIWASRIGLLEGLALVFILLSIYLFLLALENHQWFIWFGFSLGLMMLTKYTTFFVLPALFFYLLITHKKLFFNKYLIGGVIIASLIFSPVIVYNIMMFKTRGHFDLQFAKVFGQDMSDWPGITSGVSTNYLGNIAAAWNNNGNLISWPFYVFFLVMLITFLLAFTIQYQKYKNNLIIILLILFVSLQFAFISPEPRFLSILNPLVVMVSVFGLLIIYNLIGQSRYTKIDRWFLFIMVAMILVYELFYNINTNLLLKPLGGKVVNYSDNRLENLGLENVEQYFHSKYNIGDSGIRSITKKTDLDITVARDFFSGKNVYVFDPTISWFGSLWHFRRYTVYNNELFVSAADLQKAIPIQDWLDTFSNAGVKSIYYIWAIKEGEPPNDERIRQNYQSSKIIAEAFERIGASADNIYNDTGKLSFKIYKIDFERLKNYEPR